MGVRVHVYISVADVEGWIYTHINLKKTHVCQFSLIYFHRCLKTGRHDQKSRENVNMIRKLISGRINSYALNKPTIICWYLMS